MPQRARGEGMGCSPVARFSGRSHRADFPRDSGLSQRKSAGRQKGQRPGRGGDGAQLGCRPSAQGKHPDGARGGRARRHQGRRDRGHRCAGHRTADHAVDGALLPSCAAGAVPARQRGRRSGCPCHRPLRDARNHPPTRHA